MGYPSAEVFDETMVDSNEAFFKREFELVEDYEIPFAQPDPIVHNFGLPPIGEDSFQQSLNKMCF